MLLIPLLLLGQAAAGLSRPASPYTISVSTLVLRSSGDPLAVAVTGPANGSHWLGMFLLGSNLTAIARYHDYCPPGGCAETTPPFTATAPIKYWGLSNGKNLSTFSVFTINYRKPCFFAVFAGTELPRLVATSQHATFSRLSCEPTGVHLARTQTPGELRVTWQSGESNESSLRWRPAAGAVGGGGERAWQVVRAESSTYARDKLCGLPANMSIGWHDPGWIHTATFRGGDIEYAVGSGNCSDGLGALWSESRTVRAPPTPDAESVAVLFIGDMGEAPRDHPGSSHHWQMPQPTEVVDAMIAATSAQHYDAVWHVGDLAYATGYGSIWDGYMKQIEPLASIMPYYTSPGNHERDTPGTGAFQHGDDSGGECGVPFNARFIQPAGDKHSALPPSNSSDNVASWYSDNIGPIHVIFASTEHDYHPGSAQHAWLLRDLRAVDRKVTPFLVFSGHRPMYSSTTVGENAPHPYHVAGNASYNWQMGGVLEPLFEEYRVDLALWGHVHNYERSCPVLNQTCRPAGKGTVHVTSGTAGASVTLFPTFNATAQEWTTRSCASNCTKCARFKVGCSACVDVTSCTVHGGHVPCADFRCAPPPAWSVGRSEEYGYVSIEAQPSVMRVEFRAVDTDRLGAMGVVKDSFVIEH